MGKDTLSYKERIIMAPKDIKLREMVHLLYGCPLLVEYLREDGQCEQQFIDWSKGQDIDEEFLDMYVVLVHPFGNKGNAIAVTR